MERWDVVLLLLLGLLLATALAPAALAHKSPVVEYGKSGLWRTEYSFIPRQPVVGETITLTERVTHYGEAIDGDVTMTFTVYKDDSTNPWYGGKQYKELDWTLIHEADGTPLPDSGADRMQMTQFVVDKPGHYSVYIDLYEDGQYIGQDMRAVDVERRTIGPLYVIFSVIIIGATIIGVWRKVL
jgi:hypothetical protein